MPSPQAEEFDFRSDGAIFGVMLNSPPYKIFHVDLDVCFTPAEQRDVPLSAAASMIWRGQNYDSELTLEGWI
jgi:hypothetical protein